MKSASIPTTTHASGTGSHASDFTSGLPTLAGRIPQGMGEQFEAVAPPPLPELTSLPRPGERCSICGKSRTWLVEANETAKSDGMPFLFRVRQRGRMRGAVFVRVSTLLKWLEKCEAEDTATLEQKEGQP